MGVESISSFQQNDFTNAVQLSGDLNKIKSDYVNHNAEIVSKLATILIERIDKQIEEIAKLEWNVSGTLMLGRSAEDSNPL